MPDATRVLEARCLSKRYRRRYVVREADLTVGQGEIVGLLGPNGAGKTTTFYMLTGLVRPDAGQVLLDGEDITRCPMYRRARRGIGYLSQESSVFRGLTVEENLCVPLEFSGLPREEQRRRVERLLADFDIARVRRTVGARLSGGERRRVEMARALTTSPAFLLLDEPFLGVDPITITEMKGMLQRMRERGIGILLTDHNVHDALPLCDRAYVMHEGRVLVQGSAEEVAGHPDARRFYLGDDFALRNR
jgi:lipopolysaccharide export system ATP-binding protein